MHHKKLFLLFALGASVVANAKNNVHLHGKIINPLSDSISVRYNTDIVAYQPQTKAAKINGDGSFDLWFEVPQGYTRAEMNHGDQGTDLIVAPGFDLTVSLDGKNFDSTLHYEGKGSKEENFVAKHVVEHNMMLNYSMNVQPMYKMAPADFEKGLDSLQNREEQFISNNKQGLPADFISYWQNHYLYAYYGAKQYYPMYSEITRKRSYSINMDSIPAENFAVALSVPAKFDDAMLTDDVYRNYLDNLYTMPMHAAHYKNAAEGPGKYQMEDSLLHMAFIHMPPKSAEYYSAEHLYRAMRYIPDDRIEYELKQFKHHFPKSVYVATLDKAYDRIKKFGVGRTALDFTIKTIDGKTMKLSDLKGKVVLLDFWASWCGPCIAQMPAAKTLEEKYKDNDVVFLYVSIDDNETNWKRAIDMHHIEGTHMLDGAGWQGKVAKLYNVESVPSYFLIDKNGKFAVQTVPRPNEGNRLSAAIDKLLQ